MRLRIKSDETLSEQSARCMYLAIGFLCLKDEILDGLVNLIFYITKRYLPAEVSLAYNIFLILIFAAGIALQFARKINSENIRRLIHEGYKMQVKVTGHEKKGLFVPKHRLTAEYVFSSVGSGEEFCTPYFHESLSHLIPEGTRLDMYQDSNDERFYYIDISPYFKEESTLKAFFKGLRENKKIRQNRGEKMKLKIMNDETLSELGAKLLYTALAGTVFAKTIIRALSGGIDEMYHLYDGTSLKGTAVFVIAVISALYLGFIIIQPIRKMNKRNMEEIMENGIRSEVRVVEHFKKGIFHPRHRMRCVSVSDPTKEYLTGKNIETYMYKVPVGTILELYTDPQDENYYYVNTLSLDTEPTIREMREMMKR